MHMGTVVECDCGHRVSLTELLAHGFIVEDEKPISVYVRYRCEQCGAEGEHMMSYDEWNLRVREPKNIKKISERFEVLGPITTAEILAFGRALRRVDKQDFARIES